MSVNPLSPANNPYFANRYRDWRIFVLTSMGVTHSVTLPNGVKTIGQELYNLTAKQMGVEPSQITLIIRGKVIDNSAEVVPSSAIELGNFYVIPKES